MNELDVRQAVQASGEEISPTFRSDLAATLRAELAGESTPSAPVVRIDRHRRPGRQVGVWAGLGLVGAAAATVVAVVVTRDEQAGVVVTGTEPDTSISVPATGDSVPGSTEAVTPPATTEPVTSVPLALAAATAPNATSQGSAVVSPDSAKQPIGTVAIADLDVNPVPDERPDLAPVMSFLPDGALLVLDVQRSAVSVVELDGTVRWSTPVPNTVADGSLWAVALGPDDVIYLSYRIGDDQGDSFVVAAVPSTGTARGTAVRQWDTDWECVEGTCGEITLHADGIRVLWAESPESTVGYVDETGADSGATYDVSTLEQASSISDVPLPADYVVPDDGAFYGAGGLDVTLGADTWHLDALGVQFIEGAFTFPAEQPDGSVLAWVTTTKDTSLAGVTALVRMLPGGAIEQYGPVQSAYVDVVSVGGVLYAVQTFDYFGGGSGYRLVGLVPVEPSETTVTTAVPTTTIVPTASGLPPVVVDIPGAEAVDLTAVETFPAGVGEILAVRSDGSGDRFGASLADTAPRTLQLLRADGTTSDIGIPLDVFSGVVSSATDRLYVWSRSTAAGDDDVVTWRVYEPSGDDAWTAVGDPIEQTAAGECTFYVSGEGCRSAAQAAPLVAGDRVDWIRADDSLTLLTSSVDGSVTTRELDEPALDTAQCFDIDCDFQFALGPDGSVIAWHDSAPTDTPNADGTVRTSITVARRDGTTATAWLPGEWWYVAGVAGDQLVAWRSVSTGESVAVVATFDLTPLLA